MKTILSILITLLLPVASLFAQEKAWSKMTEQEKQAYMLNLSGEIIQEFGPDYYRADAPYVFEVEEFYAAAPSMKAHNGKKMHIVKFLCDEIKESLEMNYLAKVSFWAETGKPQDVMFGCGRGITFAKRSYEEQKAEDHVVIPFELGDDSHFILMSEEETSTSVETKNIVERCMELIKQYGPDYYNPEARYDIADAVYSLDGRHHSTSQNNGREYYLITFDYDLNKGLMKNYFSAAIRMWKDTGEVWNITFGNGEEVNF